MNSDSTIKVLGFSGSLRQRSLNTAALNTACELTPIGMGIYIFDLAPIPLYNQDIKDRGFPLIVEKFRREIKEADALLIVTPEYNYSIPGVLKNAIDWASRPPHQAFNGKPIGIMGASPSVFGTVRAQTHLRQILTPLNGLVMNSPEVFINNADKKFDNEGLMIDRETRDFIVKYLNSLKQWILKIKAPNLPECWGWVN